MKIMCGLGIDLYNAYKNGGDPQQVLCKIKGVKQPEQLTRSELLELTEISKGFNESALTPKDVSKVSLEFTLGEYYVVLGNFSELDITLQAIEMIEDFNPVDFERMPVMLGCIYAPMIKEMFDLPEQIAKVAANVADAVREQVLFEDVYSIFDFFGVWKENFTRVPSPSFRHSMNSYRYMRRVTKPTRMLIKRSLTHSPKKCNRITRAIKRLLFIVNILSAIVSRWFWLTIAFFREWLQKKQLK